MDDWNAPHPAATTVNGPAPKHPRALTPLAQARSFMDDFHPSRKAALEPEPLPRMERSARRACRRLVLNGGRATLHEVNDRT